MLMNPKPANYRAVTTASSPLLAIRSLSAVKQTLSITCIGERPSISGRSTLSIDPNQTLLFQACTGDQVTSRSLETLGDESLDSSGAVALGLSSTMPSMEVAVFGLGKAGSQGVLSAIPFTDVNDLRSSTAIYPGVPTGKAIGGTIFSMDLALANFGSMPRKANVLLSTGLGSPTPLVTVVVPPRSMTRQGLNLSLGASPEASIIVEADGVPGDLLSDIHARSVSRATPLSVPLPWRDQNQTPNGGQHPWRIDRGYTSTVKLYNPDALQANVVTMSIYSNDKTWTKQFSVPPLRTISVNLNDIVVQQQKDGFGNTLSPESIHGLAAWTALKDPKIFGLLVQGDSMTGIMRLYACATANAVCQVTLPSASILVGETTTDLYPATSTCGTWGDCNCVEQCVPYYASLNAWDWASSNVAIASLVSGQHNTSGLFKGISSGSTYTNVQVLDNLSCSVAGTGPITVSGPSCFAQLKYRPAVQVLGYTLGNHSFWWIQDTSAQRWITDGGPSSGPCPPNCGFLVDWVVGGDVGHYPEDNSGASLAWNSGISSAVCTGVTGLYTAAVSWPQSAYSYSYPSPNSNTFAHSMGNASGFSPTAPPNAPGW